jgi:hypothetical protein
MSREIRVLGGVARCDGTWVLVRIGHVATPDKNVVSRREVGKKVQNDVFRCPIE